MPRYELTAENHNRFAGLTKRREDRGLPTGEIVAPTVIRIDTADLLPWWQCIELSTVAAVAEARRKGLV